ncbi:MAG: hypothetical protein V7K77_05910, partial [Nostoc sp.]|uniref:hypothetical protein n=1 Tax=Nostoc sp. TaxID=1180 RepID=UPI002FF6BCBE
NERPYFSYLGRCILRIYLSLHSLVFSCLLTYTSEDDELAALAAARPRAATIKGKYDQTTSQWTAPSP